MSDIGKGIFCSNKKRRCSEGYQRGNGIWEARYRPSSKWKVMLPDSAQLVFFSVSVLVRILDDPNGNIA
jgi:hypothetical protein